MDKNCERKVVIITDIPTPYRIPLFNTIKLKLADQGIQLYIIFNAKFSERRKWKVNPNDFKFTYFFLSEMSSKYYKGLIKIVKKINPESIVVAGLGLASLKMWYYTLTNHIPLYLWTGSINVTPRKVSILIRLLRSFFFFQQRINFIVYSSASKKYLISHGVNDNRIRISLNTVDTNFFFNEVANLRSMKNPLPVNEWLYVGELVKRKNVIRLLKIVKILSIAGKDFTLNIVGDGEDRKNLEEYVHKHNLSLFVKFFGYKQKEELPAFFANAGIFLFQTDYDIWGLVLNEAMASGLCCLSSVNAVATHDLIQHGKNGYAVDFKKKEEVAQLLLALLGNPEMVSELAENAKVFIQEYATIDVSAESFMHIVENHNKIRIERLNSEKVI